jgi:lysine-specific demethylase 8
VLALLKGALECLDEADDPVEPSQGPAPAFRSLLALADEKINAVPFSSVTLEWLRLYTDATIGTALCSLVPSDGRHDDDFKKESDKWREIVRRLDMAIIVSGATGSNRPRIIQDLIKEAQRRIHKPSLVGNDTTFTSERPTKRRRLSAGRETLTASETRFSPNAIPVLETPPSIAAFLSTHRTTPFIIRGYISDVLEWPACSRWNSAKTLLHRVGLGRVVPVEIGRSYTDQGWGQQILPFERFLRLVGFPDAPPADEAELEKDREYDGLPLYLAQHALFAQFPELENDFTLPDYVYSEPPAPEDMPEYASPGNADGVVVNVWIGSGKQKVISPAHTVSPTVD